MVGIISAFVVHCNWPKNKIATAASLLVSPNTCFPCLAMLFSWIQSRKPIITVLLLPSINRKDLVYHEFSEEKHENNRLSGA
jgi:hypothetical protein